MEQDSGCKSYSKGFIMGALIGGAVGAITALLLAPKSGAELRKDIAEKSTEIYDKAGDYFQTVEGKVGNVLHGSINEGRIKAQNIVNNAKHQAEDLLANAEQVLSDAKSKAFSAKEQLQDKIGQIRDAAKAGTDAFKAEMNSAKTEL